MFFSFWLLWGGLLAIPLSLFFMRGFLRKATGAGFGALMLALGLVTGAKNYDYCGKCGTKLERWYARGRHVACPKCSPEVMYRHVPEAIRKAAFQLPPDSQEATRENPWRATGKKFQASRETVQE